MFVDPPGLGQGLEADTSGDGRPEIGDRQREIDVAPVSRTRCVTRVVDLQGEPPAPSEDRTALAPVSWRRCSVNIWLYLWL